jgi:hypothetical protein
MTYKKLYTNNTIAFSLPLHLSRRHLLLLKLVVLFLLVSEALENLLAFLGLLPRLWALEVEVPAVPLLESRTIQHHLILLPVCSELLHGIAEADRRLNLSIGQFSEINVLEELVALDLGSSLLETQPVLRFYLEKPSQ